MTATRQCEQCLSPGTRVYWQSGGALGQGCEATATHLGYTLHLCPVHDTDVSPGIWTPLGRLPLPGAQGGWRRSARGLPKGGAR